MNKNISSGSQNIDSFFESENHRNKQIFRNSFLVAIPALILFLFFSLIPFLISFIGSINDFSPLSGMKHWVGFENYITFFSSQGIPVIVNTLIINITSVILGCIYVFVMVYAVSSIKNVWLKAAVASAVLLPALIPSCMIASTFKSLYSPNLFWLTAVTDEVLRIAPFAVVASAFACIKGFDIKRVGFITVGYAMLRLINLFSYDMDYILASFSPALYESSNVLGTYIYKQGFLSIHSSLGMAAYIVKTILSFIPTVFGLIIIMLLSKKMNNTISREKEISAGSLNFPSLLSVFAIIPIILFAFVIANTAKGMNIWLNPTVPSSLFISILICTLSCIAIIVFSISMSYGMSVNNKIIFVLNGFFILFSGNIIGQYLLIYSIGLVNTMVALIINYSLYSCVGAYGIYFAYGGMKKQNFSDYIKGITPILITFAALVFAWVFGNYFIPLIYMKPSGLSPISLTLKQIHSDILPMQNTAKMIHFSTAEFAIIPAVIGTIGVFTGLVMAKLQKD